MGREQLFGSERSQTFLYPDIRYFDDAEKWEEFSQKFDKQSEHQFLLGSALYNRKRVFTEPLDTTDTSITEKLQSSRIFLDQPKVALVRYKDEVRVVVLDKQVSVAESLFHGQPILVTVDRILDEDEFSSGEYLGFNAVYSPVRNILSQVSLEKVS